MAKVQINTQGKVYVANGKALIATEGGSSAKYSLLERISDDSNNEIGTVSGFFTDANDVEYAVVCLDAQYRSSSENWMSSSGVVTDLPLYTNQTVWSSTETATFNTQKILDWCAANSYTSSSCSHCRSKSFTVGGATYYGQLPNIVELVDIFRHRVGINAADTSASSYSSLIIPTSATTGSSNQYSKANGWQVTTTGNIASSGKASAFFCVPVLELPNQ